MKGYSARDVATMLGLSVSQVRSYASTGFLAPERGEKGEYLFSFHDLVLLRAAKELTDAQIPPRRIKRSLERLKEQLPVDRPLTGVRISADGERVVVRDGSSAWNPDSGQSVFDFSLDELETRVAPFAQRRAEAARGQDGRDAQEWYELGCEVEYGAPEEAEEAYRKAIAIDPGHADAHVNLGRMLHERRAFMQAEQHYRTAIRLDPDHTTAHFNLGVLLEDRGKADDAIEAYRAALSSDPDYADAHFNLAGVYEAAGNRAAALRHLKEYKKLVG